MSERVPSDDLPLLLAGIPAAVQGWLRQTGIPFAAFGQAAPVAGRIVLYDSRSLTSRCDAEAARAAGLTAIDAFGLLEGAPRRQAVLPRFLRRPQPVVSRLGRFFAHLKNAVERQGGTWARVADYPFPWQCAACWGDGRFAAEFSEISEAFLASAESIEERYPRGVPFFVEDGQAPGSDHRYPLLWRTTCAEFGHWWRVRSQITFRLRQESDAYRIECRGDFGGFRPMLELWQGTHVASLPMPAGEKTVERGGLVFQHRPDRHPAGLTVHGSERLHDLPEAARREPQPA
jgi:hypothetical protein